MRFVCSLNMPNDVRFVTVARHFSRNTFAEFGVESKCQQEIALAVTEACANAVEHSRQRDESFEVIIEIDEAAATIRVIDTGTGIPPERHNVAMPAPDSERGRGFFLMQSLVDNVSIATGPGGTEITLSKTLVFTETTSPLLAG